VSEAVAESLASSVTATSDVASLAASVSFPVVLLLVPPHPA
jgi:hypothetical protein